ncbi:hypothetical protein [Paenibacillus polysaccharolyticus]|uniref:hypothetical protein n=1 Tax=Paenibacillus polysaccharolyticus TaxID=582692 RepID=UPI001113B449|nr:hypothetical protein [Paenibacillus polysaccharolyticus]
MNDNTGNLLSIDMERSGRLFINIQGSNLPADTTGDTFIMQIGGNLFLYNTTLTNAYYPNSWIPV